ncbi:vitamin K epoxide reductase family protein [Albibacterium indicum]|uniref:vitamin K epoxide reductase family protein n=1 Tax=Albibacterium indicum TaxID=2292082 RepID=UPI000E4DB219|nr:vitamin K epoxide reductase family protein [Pedobacter indicus]
MHRFYKNLVNSEDNILNVSGSLVSAMKISVTKTSLKEALERHPDYPSMLTLSDVLKQFNIQNFAAKFSLIDLKGLPTPFIALIRPTDSDINYYSLITKVKPDTVTFISPKSKKSTRLNWEDFEKIYQGVGFVAESDEVSGQKDYVQSLKKEKRKKNGLDITLLFIPVLILIYGLYEIIFKNFQITLVPVLFNWFNLIGWIITSLLLWYDIDSSNSSLQEVCEGKGNKKKNCGSVLKSNGASVFGFTWSHIGFSFFSALLFGHLLGGIANPGSQIIVASFIVLGSFYIPFSIFYQWKILSQWCVLCLAVQAILSIQLVYVFVAGWLTQAVLIDSFPIKELFIVLLSGLAPFILTGQLMSILKQNKKYEHYKKNFLKFKFNKHIFDSLLKNQKQLVFPSENLGIKLGNPDAKYKIIKVCNPYCGPCAKAHPIIDQLLEKNKNVSVQIIFSTSNAEDNLRTKASKHLLAIAEDGNELKTKKALDDWYNAPTKDYEIFASKYVINGELKQQSSKVELMSKWCNDTGISFTPTFFVNGFQLPENYTIEDLNILFAE